MEYEMRVSEIFGPTIQGEGEQIGRPTVFVRFGGCDYRCDWCDSLYAVLPAFRSTWTKMTAEQIMTKVGELSSFLPILVTLSGGNPALWDLEGLIEIGHRTGCTFTMETQGSIAKPWFAQLDHLCISPKPPSSKMNTDFDQLTTAIAMGPEDTILKVVVFDEEDFQYAKMVHNRYKGVPFYLQVGNLNPKQDQQANVGEMLKDLEELSMRCIRERMYDVRVLPQLHALMWGNKRAV